MGNVFANDAELQAYLSSRSNWGRWGADDEMGTLNLITQEKRARAATLVRSGRTVSLSRPLSFEPGLENSRPAQYGMRLFDMGYAQAAGEHVGTEFHAATVTHIDALCHYWDHRGIWGGRDPAKVITFGGATFGSIDKWAGGIVTRGVLLDIPRYRGEPFVTNGNPVLGSELEAAARSEGVAVSPGDALLVYSGREAWKRADPEQNVLRFGVPVPGLHASCLPFIRENDIAVLAWDLMDAKPSGYAFGAPIHAAIFAFGLALIDNVLLEPLAEACREEGRYEFLLLTAPLHIPGGTGSPVNPIAIL